LSIRVDGQRLVSAPDYSMMRAMNLRAGTEEATHLRERYGFTDGPTGTGKLTALLNQGDFSIFHFAGHSVIPDRDDGTWGLPKLVLNDSKLAGDAGKEIRSGLSPTMLRRRSMHNAGPLIFLNACTTGGLYDTPTGGNTVRGFPDGFLAAGAGVFIGTHWEVEDGPAKRFAASFYGEFLENGKTLTDAVSSARRTAGSGGWSPSPLAYVAYGHPDARAADE
jgi:CHAT domain-containing protein